ncbi:transposase [Ktedonospora formicarum]|uniref:transposase n=1 Tax=Ktedonospora formicarum TaxID=2778364 RepID=UPI001C68CEA1|nr:transposase [Ktedonospora formicarum]
MAHSFYLAVTLDIPLPVPDESTKTLGVGLGVVNLATDSTGEIFSGDAVEKTRQRTASRANACKSAGPRAPNVISKSFTDAKPAFVATPITLSASELFKRPKPASTLSRLRT